MLAKPRKLKSERWRSGVSQNSVWYVIAIYKLRGAKTVRLVSKLPRFGSDKIAKAWRKLKPTVRKPTRSAEQAKPRGISLDGKIPLARISETRLLRSCCRRSDTSVGNKAGTKRWKNRRKIKDRQKAVRQHDSQNWFFSKRHCEEKTCGTGNVRI